MVMCIKARREAAGLTQLELAEAMSVLQSAVSNWETENALPRSRQLPALARILGCSINDLFNPEYQDSISEE